jgi:hypothetical protein
MKGVSLRWSLPSFTKKEILLQKRCSFFDPHFAHIFFDPHFAPSTMRKLIFWNEK